MYDWFCTIFIQFLYRVTYSKHLENNTSLGEFEIWYMFSLTVISITLPIVAEDICVQLVAVEEPLQSPQGDNSLCTEIL